MTFIAKNTKVFLKQTPDDLSLALSAVGKLRSFEDGMDSRCWGINCFRKHAYLLELIAINDQVRSGRDMERQKSHKLLGDGEKDPGDAAQEQNTQLNTVGSGKILDMSASAMGDNSYRRPPNILVDISKSDTMEQVSVKVSSNKDTIRCRCDPNTVFLQIKLSEVIEENEALHQKLYALEQTKSAYVYKIEGDLERYSELCKKQKDSITALKKELQYMYDQLGNLQKCMDDRARRSCHCGRPH